MGEQEVEPRKKICFGFFMLVKYALKIRVDEQNEAFQESNLTTSLFFIVDIVVDFSVAVVVVVVFSVFFIVIVCFSLSLWFYFRFYRRPISISRDRNTNKSHE